MEAGGRSAVETWMQDTRLVFFVYSLFVVFNSRAQPLPDENFPLIAVDYPILLTLAIVLDASCPLVRSKTA
jgi:hypothetical protein